MSGTLADLLDMFLSQAPAIAGMKQTMELFMSQAVMATSALSKIWLFLIQALKTKQEKKYGKT